MKFQGNGSCTSCHGEAVTAVPPPSKEAAIKQSSSAWTERDAHAKAFESLGSDKGKAIAAAMNIADAATDASCLSCHALNAPENLRGDNFVVEEGNTCGSCHGPSEKWLQPHAAAGWTDGMRAKMPHDKLLSEWGIYDTKPAVERAQICVACHLQIPAAMVKAGHPQTTLEIVHDQDYSHKMATLDAANGGKWRHWPDPANKADNAKLWLAGQVVNLESSLGQLAARKDADAAQVEDAYNIAAANLAILDAAIKAGAPIKIDGLDATIKAVAAAKGNAAGLAAVTAPAGWKAAIDALHKKDLAIDAATAKKIAQAIAALDLSAYGKYGAEVQGKSLYALTLAQGAVPEAVKALQEAYAGEAFDAAAYKSKLDAAKGGL
jgi:hypothetical protein